MFLDLILASRGLFALPGVRCLLFIFSCPDLPLSLCPLPGFVAETRFRQAPAALSSCPLSCWLPGRGWFSGEGRWEKSIQGICFKAISVSPWDLCGHIFLVFFQRNRLPCPFPRQLRGGLSRREGRSKLVGWALRTWRGSGYLPGPHGASACLPAMPGKQPDGAAHS